MFFVLIVTRKNFIIFIELILIVYFRGFSLGVIINSLLINNFIWCLFIVIIELLLSFILFFIIINDCYNINNINDYKLIYITIITVLIFSLLLEIVGGKFG